MKNLLTKTAGTWVFILFLLMSCGDSLEHSIIESENYETHLAEKEVSDSLKKKGEKGNSEENKGKGKGKDKDDDSDDDNNGKSEDNKGKGKDKDSSEDETTEDEESADRNNNGRSEENKGKGRDKEDMDSTEDDSDDEDSDEDEDETEDQVSADFRTQTIGGWGAKPRGNNPGAYLHDNFDAAFAEGIILGQEEFTVTFTSAQAVTDFLPSGSKAAVLSESFIDPTSKDLKNNFVSQMLAVSLTIGFDAAIADFSKSDVLFEDLVIAEGDLAGISVRRIIDESNKVLVGERSEISIEDLQGALTAINESFVDGKGNSKYLKV